MDRLAKQEVNLKRDLCRMARFGANITDSHSCFIFLPPHIVEPEGSTSSNSQVLHLGGFHSLSNDVIEQCRIESGSGIIGWVAKHHQSIHVSPFEHDSRTLGIYRNDQRLKSFIGIPVPLDFTVTGSNSLCGVVACDSKKSYAFSKLQGKLLEDLAFEIANSLRLTLFYLTHADQNSSWRDFMVKAQALVEALGRNSVEVMRVRAMNLDELEQERGTVAATELLDQLFRLIQQGLPPHCPSYRLPQGDIIIVLDNMMASFYQNKIETFAEHLRSGGAKLEFHFKRQSFRRLRQRTAPLEDLIQATGFGERKPVITLSQTIEADYEHRRA